MEKINYIIATWSGNRRVPNDNYLKEHLLKLLSLKHNLSQITIVKPIFPGCNTSYYDIEDLLDKFDCKVVILEKNTNYGQSYGQLFHAYERFKNEFDYYIFIEDDYIPNINNFDSLLLDEYRTQNVNGYLCSFAGVNKAYPNGGCSISNGMISTKYMEHIYEKNNNPIARIDGGEGYVCHQNFADLILECGLFFKDFIHKYRVPYFGTNIIEYGRTDTDESIFVPNQLFDIKLNFREMTINDLPEFIEIRNQSKEYLHNNKTFSLDESILWFNNVKPQFYIIEMGSKIIGYFRTSNHDLDKKTLYIGCDLQQKYRGYGLGYKAYVQFLPIIKKQFQLEKIKLEVLSNNTRAINLYHKLGFVNIGISEEKIFRDGNELNSIIMEL